MQIQALGFVACPDERNRIARHLRGHWNVRHRPTIRTREAQLAIRQALDGESFFVHRPVMATAQQREIRERRGATLCPVAEVVALPDADATPGEATAAVAMV